jgi:hypothetical protein
VYSHYISQPQQLSSQGSKLLVADVALPQAIAYMAANPQSDRATFALVSNGIYLIFLKFDRSQYGFSEDFSLNRRQNEL